MSKPIRPLFSTIVMPTEYDFDDQWVEWLESANDFQRCYYDIDVGKAWGLYLEYKNLKSLVDELSFMVNQPWDNETLADSVRSLMEKSEGKEK